MRSGSIKEKGFSLIEMMIAMTILLVITSFVVRAFTSGIRTMRRERALVERDNNAKRAIELMTTEIGHAGVAPDLLELESSDGPVINSDIGPGTTNITIQNLYKGFYPGRTISLGLPEGDPLLSEKLKIKNLDPVSKTIDLETPTTLVHEVNPTLPTIPSGSVTSPMLPLPFGILNPPPLSGGTGPGSTLLSATNKTIKKIGFVGDILGDGNLQYVEYSLSNGRLLRSITPISEPTKGSDEILLENIDVSKSDFTLVYPNRNLPVPVAVRITILSKSSVPEPRITGGKINPDTTFKSVITTTEVMPRGTSAAALIWANGGEKQLREMLPPCIVAGGKIGYPPCNWSGVQWWGNVFTFSTGLP
jgi:prepilin-type N-terminal cleavage/methylation domain-containing protein